MKSKASNQPDFGIQYDDKGMILDPHPPLSFDPDAMSSITNAIKPPTIKNKHEAAIELLIERIKIAIEQMPVPLSEANDVRLMNADQKLWEALSALID